MLVAAFVENSQNATKKVFYFFTSLVPFIRSRFDALITSERALGVALECGDNGGEEVCVQQDKRRRCRCVTVGKEKQGEQVQIVCR